MDPTLALSLEKMGLLGPNNSGNHMWGLQKVDSCELYEIAIVYPSISYVNGEYINYSMITDLAKVWWRIHVILFYASMEEKM